MLARELAVVGRATAVVILGRVLEVGLCRHALTPRVTLVGKMVEDIFQLILVVPARREEREVEHRAHTAVVVILVVDRVAQVIAAVVGHIVHAEEVVLHVLILPVVVRVVQGSDHSELATADLPAITAVDAQLDITPYRLVLDRPVVVEPSGEQPLANA